MGLVIIIIGLSIYSSKIYYPTLPIEGVGKKEVLSKLNNATNSMVKLTTEDGSEWFIIDERDTAAANEIIKEMVSQDGWSYIEQNGSGLFFEKQGERLIVTTQKWTGDYLLVQIPDNFSEK